MSYLGFVPEKIIKKCIKNLNNAQSLLELLIIEQALRRFELDIPDDL